MSSVPPTQVLTHDSVTVAVDGVIYFSIKDALRVVTAVADYRLLTDPHGVLCAPSTPPSIMRRGVPHSPPWSLGHDVWGSRGPGNGLAGCPLPGYDGAAR
ncbi:hypothetical protein E2C01_013439 [Portunus trituberculatus]|uniref:Uncharacterized protein n=1 Tax=Portunus trituberculatus TaxID=210409 RepID=A0A5B7DG79_PORTR|nr:hypothetical protein [Portunus trituberculatus]